MNITLRSILFVTLLLALQACHTGVEMVGRVTSKDVQRAYSRVERSTIAQSLEGYRDSLPAWHEGKQFTVSDDQVRLIFAPSDQYKVDDLRLQGKVITYKGYETTMLLDNRRILNLIFTDGKHRLVYHSGKTLDEFTSQVQVPFLIDNDFVALANSLMRGKILYIKSAIWYNPDTEQMTAGRKFVAVKIDSVLPGNKVFPLKVTFTAVDNGARAMVWMSGGDTFIRNRGFDALFSLTDVHRQYPSISDEIWQRIVNGTVTYGMTKEECQLSKGAPKSIARDPDQTGMREYWFYDSGGYLKFEDGILKEFRE